MRMLCYKCNHPWRYKGNINEGKIYVTCPNCMRKVRVDRSLVEDSSEQRLLTNVSEKPMKTTSLPLELPTTTSFKIEFESIKDEDGFTYHVDKRISKQFRESLNEKEIEETPLPGIEPRPQEQTMRIIPWLEIIRVIPYDPIKHLEHQKDYNLNIANTF